MMPYKAKPIEEGRYALRFDVFEGDRHISSKVLSQPVIKVGKLSSSGIRLEDDEVSRMHAVIEVNSPDDIYIVDLGSRFGTFLNGVRVNKANLKVGDEIVLGSRARIVIRDPRDKKGNVTGFEPPVSPPSPPSPPLPPSLQESMDSTFRAVAAIRRAFDEPEEKHEQNERMSFTECLDWAEKNEVFVHFARDGVYAWIEGKKKVKGATFRGAICVLRDYCSA